MPASTAIFEVAATDSDGNPGVDTQSGGFLAYPFACHHRSARSSVSESSARKIKSNHGTAANATKSRSSKVMIHPFLPSTSA